MDKPLETTQPLPSKGLAAKIGGASLIGLQSSLLMAGSLITATIGLSVLLSPAGTAFARSLQVLSQFSMAFSLASIGVGVMAGVMAAQSKFPFSAEETKPAAQAEPEWHIAHPKV